MDKKTFTLANNATQIDGSVLQAMQNLPYNIFQNAGESQNTGGEITYQQEVATWVSFNTSVSLYRNTIDAFTINNRHPVPTVYTMPRESIMS